MKYFVIFLVAFALGYGVYPYFNKSEATNASQELTSLFEKFLKEEAGKYADASSPEDKLKAADEMYGKMMILFLSQLDLKGKENKPVEIKIDVHPEKKIVKEVPVKIPVPLHTSDEESKEELTLAEKLQKDTTIDGRTYITLQQLPFISDKDSRITKLTGVFSGKLKRKNSRTGLLENIQLEINQDPEKRMTKLLALDVYDNSSLNFYQETSQSFKSVPGDENLLLMTMADRTSVVFNLKRFPKISGRLFEISHLAGEFDLAKSKSK